MIIGTILGRILSLILVLILILLPGWISVFKGKTVGESLGMLFLHFPTTIKEVANEAWNFYKEWFKKETEKAIEQGKEKAIEEIEKNKK